MKKSLLTIFMLAVVLTQVSGQYTTLNAHSHNDYENVIPFRLAYDNRFGSIEADIWAVNGELYVAHYQADIKPGRTLEALYINPIAEIFKQNGGRAWKNDTATFQLLIDLKTPVEPTLSILISKLEPLRAVFDPEFNPFAVRIVLSGNRPEPAGFENYPSFIFYDGLLNRQYNEQQLKKVPLYSENLRKFTSWNGDGDIIQTEKNRILGVIDSIHSLKKKIRFWNAPDNINAWSTFINMGVDYLNTDHIVLLSEYLKSKTR